MKIVVGDWFIDAVEFVDERELLFLAVVMAENRGKQFREGLKVRIDKSHRNGVE